MISATCTRGAPTAAVLVVLPGVPQYAAPARLPLPSGYRAGQHQTLSEPDRLQPGTLGQSAGKTWTAITHTGGSGHSEGRWPGRELKGFLSALSRVGTDPRKGNLQDLMEEGQR